MASSALWVGQAISHTNWDVWFGRSDVSGKILTFECSEDVYTAFKNVLAHASDTAPIVTVLVTKTDIILNTTDLTGDYALVYSPDRNPEKNAINCDYTKKAGNGWYHIWYS